MHLFLLFLSVIFTVIKSEAGSLLTLPQEFQTRDQVYAKGASHCLKEQTVKGGRRCPRTAFLLLGLNLKH